MQEVGVQVESDDPASATPALLFDGLAVTGTEVSGEFRCTDCGYGAVVHRALPQCPMCGGTVWESRTPPAPRPLG